MGAAGFLAMATRSPSSSVMSIRLHNADTPAQSADQPETQVQEPADIVEARVAARRRVWGTSEVEDSAGVDEQEWVNPEIAALLARAAQSPTVRRNRRPAPAPEGPAQV